MKKYIQPATTQFDLNMERVIATSNFDVPVDGDTNIGAGGSYTNRDEFPWQPGDEE
ncbi:MAG: hypothetical protein ACI4V2_04295 [Alloprevotella sp.]